MELLKLDLCSGYNELELDAASKEISISSTPSWLCRHKRLTWGVKSASEDNLQTLERKFLWPSK